MKFLNPFFFIIIFCVSCNKNTDEIEVIEKVQNSKRNISLSLEPVEDPEKAKVEQLMYMTSFLIGKTLLENEAARDYFYEQIKSVKTNKIELINILDASFIDSNPFEIGFHEQFNNYNWHIDPQGGSPDPPKSTSLEPDPLKWGGILDSQMYYQQYLIEIIDLKKWELYFPNKNVFLENYQNFTDYLADNHIIRCSWNNDSFNLYSDGMVLYDDGRGEYLSRFFDPFRSLSFMFVLRDIID